MTAVSLGVFSTPQLRERVAHLADRLGQKPPTGYRSFDRERLEAEATKLKSDLDRQMLNLTPELACHAQG
jgi:hypothetical protein